MTTTWTHQQQSLLVEPHGGTLINRFVTDAAVPQLCARARDLPRLTLDARELADLELIATGAASPLTGFLGAADYHSVLERLRLANGIVWPLPLTLAVTEEVRATLGIGQEVALGDSAGRLWATLHVTEIYQRNNEAEAKAIYRTVDPTHPGVAYLEARPTWLVAGDVQVLPLPELPFSALRLPPRVLRQEIQRRGWRRVAGFQTRNPIHRAHEHLTKVALEWTDGLVIHPLVGETKGDDIPAVVRLQTYQTLLDQYYPKERTLLAVFPAAMRYAGPREALFHAIVRKNYGITHLIVGRDHAGVGKFYGPYEAQEIFDQFPPEDIGVQPLRFEPTFYCTVCDNLASSRTCPHDATARVELAGTKVRELLASGGHLPPQFTRPEVAEILRAHYRLAAATPTSGFIVWFTGLSGAGKSTLAHWLKPALEQKFRVEILDGDEVRTFLSKGLGFSKADRDTNIRRIGYVARLLARHGVAVITAAISPYADTRNEVRAAAAQEGIPFIEVFVQAELAALIQRDVKGLYKKALAGELPHFTGISDPYEPPLRPEATVRSDQETVEESAARILAVIWERLETGKSGGSYR